MPLSLLEAHPPSSIQRGRGPPTVLRLPLSFLYSTKQLELWFSSLQEDAGQTPGDRVGCQAGREGQSVSLVLVITERP